MASQPQPAPSYIEVRSNRDGKPRTYLAGTRIHVSDIAIQSEIHRKSPDEIVAAFPQLSLAQVHAALAHSFDHRATIAGEQQEDEDYARRMKQQTGPGPLEQKLNQAKCAVRSRICKS
jgi:uncharacterized protein (DUF433 family)